MVGCPLELLGNDRQWHSGCWNDVLEHVADSQHWRVVTSGHAAPLCWSSRHVGRLYASVLAGMRAARATLGFVLSTNAKVF